PSYGAAIRPSSNRGTSTAERPQSAGPEGVSKTGSYSIQNKTNSEMAARKRSIVWSFFQAEDDKRVLCLLCMKTVLYFGHTTNMLRHLRAKHPNDFSALDKRKATAVKAASNNNNNGCVEVTVMMDEQQVEVQNEVGEVEMDGAIRGILCAAAGEGTTEGEVSGCEGEGKGAQEGSPVPLTPTTRKWSAVWVHYRKVDQEKKALCLLCMEKIQHQSSTSNLIRHLQNKHPTEYAQLEEHPQKRPTKRKPEDPDYCPPSPAKSRTVSSNRNVQSPLNSSITDKYSGVDWSDGRKILERERELTEALRRVQQEEGRSLQQQRELMQQIRDCTDEKGRCSLLRKANRPLTSLRGWIKSNMLLHYCPHCGSKLQSGFKFCPSCGEKLPCLVNSAETADSETAVVSDPVPHGSLYSLSPGPHSVLSALNSSKDAVEASASSSLTRSPIFRSTRQTATKITSSPTTPLKAVKDTDQRALTSPRKRKMSPKVQEVEEPKEVSSSSAQTSPDQKCLSPRKRKASPKVQEEAELKKVSLPLAHTPPSAKSKAKRARRLCVVEPVQEGMEFCDQSGKKWKLVKLLFQTEVELTYGVQQVSVGTSSEAWKHILRLGAKEGQLFNEQNFLQRAAKPATVEKWMKKLNMDFLGIPSCVGFGLHDTYRFLIFPDMGQTLQSVMDTEMKCLTEKAVLQLALRLLDALEFVHESEYTHADIHAGNIYISTVGHSQVFLSGFGHAFRFCPGGNHVEYREGSRTPHQGNLNFISLDSHKGAGPSRRSDLQSLGYCLLSWMTGILPWSDISQSSSAISAEKEKYMTDVLGLMSSCFKKRRVSGVLQSYLSQAMGLHYTEKPDYSFLKAELNEALQKMGGTLGEPLIFR
ncbi:hypothetical protein AOLI_G00147290, partial [Acnodon oligacanthus]